MWGQAKGLPRMTYQVGCYIETASMGTSWTE